MPKSKPRLRPLVALVPGQLHQGRPTEPLNDEIRDMIERAQRSPAWPYIADGFMLLARVGLDRGDPAIVRQIIERGEELHRTPPRREPAERMHEPVVYYFRLGELVKIGTTSNIGGRVAALNPQAILAVERGGYAEESERHRLFAGLRVHGEWFSDADPLTSYVRAVVSDFPRDFGCSLADWLAARGVAHRPQVDMIDTEVYS